ncbi:hypothetical protein MP638_005550 [Amoeboaphelidium occidentale]|nr:hypothetical protein MP638_005550 [Amoeboaphelidium occidentale]
MSVPRKNSGMINMIPDQPRDKNDRRSVSVATPRKTLEEGRPMSVVTGPSQPMQYQGGRKTSPASSVVSSSSRASSRPASLRDVPAISRQIAPNQGPSNAPQSPMIRTAEDAIVNFNEQKAMAKKKIKYKMSASSRLVNSLADITVCLLSRAMQENILDEIEIRIYKKPLVVGNNVYVLEYKDGSKKDDKKPKKDPKLNSEAADSDFVVVTVGEMIADDEKDNIENWKQFFDVVRSWSLWWRYCMAIHRRIGWKVGLDRSFLNVIDARVLGFVTIKIKNFV